MFPPYLPLASSWISELAPTLLLSLRLSAVLLMTPVLYAIQLPTSVRMLFIIGLAATLQAGHPIEARHIPQDAATWLAEAATELALGATLGLGIHVAFAAFSIAGRLLDIQIGFGMAQVLDPATRRQLPILTAVLTQAGVLIFFLVNGHLALLRALYLSLEVFPLGARWVIANTADATLGQMSGLFILGFAMVAPVVFSVLVVELVLGVISRNLPQMNIFMLALPVKIAVALTMLSLWSYNIGGVMNRTYASIADNWTRLMLAQRAAEPALGRGR